MVHCLLYIMALLDSSVVEYRYNLTNCISIYRIMYPSLYLSIIIINRSMIIISTSISFSIYYYIEQHMKSQIIIINNSKNRVHLGLRESVDPSCSSTSHINCTMRNLLLLLLSIYFITNYIRSISIHSYIHHHHHHHIYQ